MSYANPKFAIIVSQFNATITEKLLQGALTRLKELHVKENEITITRVPGAYEIPLVAKILAKTKDYSAIICLGAVIRGETDHYQYVCEQVSNGCSEVMLQYELPVIFGVLTTENVRQAEERTGGKKGHKGMEAADAAFAMVEILARLSAG